MTILRKDKSRVALFSYVIVPLFLNFYFHLSSHPLIGSKTRLAGGIWFSELLDVVRFCVALHTSLFDIIL